MSAVSCHGKSADKLHTWAALNPWLFAGCLTNWALFHPTIPFGKVYSHLALPHDEDQLPVALPFPDVHVARLKPRRSATPAEAFRLDSHH